MFIVCAISVVVGALWDQKKNVDERVNTLTRNRRLPTSNVCNTMRGYGFTEIGGPDKQAFIDVPIPQPGSNELRVRVRAAGVNPGDWRLREGSYGHSGPAVLGREVAGTVVALGPEISEFAIGDEVFGGCPAWSAVGPKRR